MHSGTSRESNLQNLLTLDLPLARSALVSRSRGELSAAIVCDTSAEEGNAYLLGPWAVPGCDALRAELVDEVLGKVAVARFHSYSHIDNVSNRGLYTSRGFVEREPASIYRLREKPELVARELACCPALERRDFASFAELHAATFPSTYFSAEEIAKLSKPHRVFVVREEGKVVGYVHAGRNDDPRAGYIHYIAVHERWRRRGYGRRLLLSALDWLFSECGYASVALNSSSRHGQARRLYESLGFELEATGVGARLERSP